MKNASASKTEKNIRGMVQELSEILKNMHEDQQRFDKTVAKLKGTKGSTKNK